MFANINSLLSSTGRVAKIPILAEETKKEQFLFLALTESHLNETSKAKEYHIEGYSNTLCNRRGRSGGGIILYLKESLSYKVIVNASDNMCSFLSIYIKELNLALLLAYRPPPDYSPCNRNKYHGPPLAKSFKSIIIDQINNTINKLGSPVPDILLMGDFNFPNALWRQGTGVRINGTAPESLMLNSLINTCDSLSLLQKVTVGTRDTPSGGSNILDLIFTNNHQLKKILIFGHQKSLTTRFSDVKQPTSTS